MVYVCYMETKIEYSFSTIENVAITFFSHLSLSTTFLYNHARMSCNSQKSLLLSVVLLTDKSILPVILLHMLCDETKPSIPSPFDLILPSCSLTVCVNV